MPNESPGVVLLLDLEFSGEALEGKIHETSSAGGALSIDWTSTRRRRGFAPVAGGVFYFKEANGTSKKIEARGFQFHGEAPGGSLYRWAWDGESGVRLAAILLPVGYVYANPKGSPAPVAAKEVGGRLSVFWTPDSNSVTWLMRKGEVGPGVALINRDSPTGGKIRGVHGVSIVEPGNSRLRPPVVGAAMGAASLLAVALLIGRLEFQQAPKDDGRGVTAETAEEEPTAWYEHSYALIVGVDSYPSERWADLKYARNDAEGMAAFLDRSGFKVVTLFDEDATKEAIISAMQNELAPKLGENDRVLVFFAGHGHTEELAERDWGYVVPYIAETGVVSSARYISMEELQALSEKMGRAKHQLFIMDACYGGLLGTKAGRLDPNRPNYIRELLKRKARQVLTAGGKDQQVADGGSGGHSVFTGYLLEGLEKGLADSDGDEYITFSELVVFIQPGASSALQTPGQATLPGHGLGEFVFAVERAQPSPGENTKK